MNYELVLAALLWPSGLGLEPTLIFLRFQGKLLDTILSRLLDEAKSLEVTDQNTILSRLLDEAKSLEVTGRKKTRLVFTNETGFFIRYRDCFRVLRRQR